jgi:hypothetical protein
LSVEVAELWDFFWKIVASFRVFRWETLHRRRASSGGGPGGPHPLVARPVGGCATLGCGYPLAHLQLPFGLCPSSGKNRSFGLYFVQF